jgi:long-chain fatty acid transport protein
MKKWLLPSLLIFTMTNSCANVIQFFTGINYDNPAELFQTKDLTFLLGGTGVYLDARYTGSQLNLSTGAYPTGVNHSRTTTVLPYGRLAKRFSDKLVIGVDVTEPYNSNLNWGSFAFTNYANAQNKLTDIEVSPRMSLAITQTLFAGLGLNLNFLENNEINWALPIGFNRFATLVNKSDSFGLGWNVGVFKIINQQNMIGIVYYSKIKQETTGNSYFLNMVNTNFASTFYMPATTVIHYLHIFNPKWVLSAKAYITEWSANQNVAFINTAAPPPAGPNFIFPLQFKDSWAFLVATHYQHDEKFGFLAGFMTDFGPEHDNLRPLAFPSDTRYFFAVGSDYRINKTTKIELLYGHGFSRTSLNNTIVLGAGPAIPFSRGGININADVIDLKIKVEA